MILYIKQKMRMAVKKFKEKKKINEKQRLSELKEKNVSIGFMSYLQKIYVKESPNKVPNKDINVNNLVVTEFPSQDKFSNENGGKMYQTQQPLIENTYNSNRNQQTSNDLKLFANFHSQDSEQQE